MQRTLFLIDSISTWVGKACAWLMIALTAVVCYDVFMRYIVDKPTLWAFDASYMMYGTLFMMCGAYTLAQNGHVRGDFIYISLSMRWQAALDLVLYIVFFVPGIAALAWFGVDFAAFSWHLNEHSSLTSGGPPLYHFKTMIPLAGALLMLQGLAEIARCVICLKTGRWPQRLRDVEEIDVVEMQMKEAIHVSEEERQRAIDVARQLENSEVSLPRKVAE